MAFTIDHPTENIACVPIPSSAVSNNVFLVGSPDNYLIFDSGTQQTSAELIETLEAGGYGPKGVRAIIPTHGHLDHYGGIHALHQWCAAEIWAHPAAAVQMEDHWSDFITRTYMFSLDWNNFQDSVGENVRVDRLLREGDTLEHEGMNFDLYHMPGHERGQLTFFEPNRRVAVVGDLIQGGVDASNNWLGLFSDVEGQKRSLQRLLDLKPEFIFKGHRKTITGVEIIPEIETAQERVIKIENAVLETLAEHGPGSVESFAETVYKKVMGDYEQGFGFLVLSIQAFLGYLNVQGKVKRNADFLWEVVKN